MAHKRMEEGKIRTTNGVDTVTYPVYVKELVTYEPRPDGWNQELAEAVYDWIADHRALWNQDVWRQFVPSADTPSEVRWLIPAINDPSHNEDYVYNELGTEISKALAVAGGMQDGAVGACGTTMCLAGWIAEFAGADWVIDAKLLGPTKIRQVGQSQMRLWGDAVFVPINEISPRGRKTGKGWSGIDYGHLSEEIIEHARARGFTPNTHDIWPVRVYAAHALGIKDEAWDMPAMFEGSNTFEDLRAAIDHYNAHGPGKRLDPDDLPSRQPGGVNYDEDDE